MHETDSQVEFPVACPVLCPSVSQLCQIGFGGIKKLKSSFSQKDQRVPTDKNGFQAAARAQASEAGPDLWAGWCLLFVSPVALGERGGGVGVRTHSQILLQGSDGSASQAEPGGAQSHQQLLTQARAPPGWDLQVGWPF